LTLLNPGDDPQTASIGPGLVVPVAARRTSLSGETIEDLQVSAGGVSVEIGPRAWTRIAIALK
jgi:hypothetical protein